MAVTLYRANLIANAQDYDPAQLARDFVATLKGEMFPDYAVSGSLRVDDQFAWWLAHPKAMNCTWEPEDWGQLINALDKLMNDEVVCRIVLNALPLTRY